MATSRIGRPPKVAVLAAAKKQSIPDFIMALVAQHGTVVKAAVAIDLSPSTLRHHMRLHGLKASRREVIEKASA